jgi:hypothetical protein
MPGAGRLACLIALGWITTSLARDKFVDLSHSKHHPAGSAPISLSTLDRLEDMGWWPTK